MASLSSSKNEILQALFSNQAYKPGQGHMLRYGTLAAILFFVVAGAYSWMNVYATAGQALRWGVPLAMVLAFGWLAYRLVHWPRFADFLISTEGEMAKVSWPAWNEVRVSTIVVLISVIVMSVFLFATDQFWQILLYVLGVLKIPVWLFGGGSQNQ